MSSNPAFRGAVETPVGVLDYEISEIPAPIHAEARAVHAVWQARRDALGRVPARDDISLRDLGALSRSVFLVTSRPGASDVSGMEYRRVGSQIEFLLGFPISNRRLSEFFSAEAASLVYALYDRVMRGGDQVFIRGRLKHPSLEWFEGEALILPLQPIAGAGWALGGFYLGP